MGGEAASCIGSAYFFLLDQVTYLNHFYVIILFGVLLGFTDAHRCGSLDRRLGRVAGNGDELTRQCARAERRPVLAADGEADRIGQEFGRKTDEYRSRYCFSGIFILLNIGHLSD